MRKRSALWDSMVRNNQGGEREAGGHQRGIRSCRGNIPVKWRLTDSGRPRGKRRRGGEGKRRRERYMWECEEVSRAPGTRDAKAKLDQRRRGKMWIYFHYFHLLLSHCIRAGGFKRATNKHKSINQSINQSINLD